MNLIFRILLTFNATSLLVLVFLVQKGFTLGHFIPCLVSSQKDTPNIYSYLAYMMVPIVLTYVSIIFSSKLGKDQFAKGDVVSIGHANNSFLPSYLGYFFVALSIQNWETLAIVYGILFVFTFLSQALYFNPLFLLFNYEFYNISTKNGASIFLISNKDYKLPADVELERLYRINNYTFIEMSKS